MIIYCTNPAKDKRKVYLDLAKKLKVKIRAFVMDIDKEMAKKMQKFKKSLTQLKYIHILGHLKRFLVLKINKFLEEM